MDTAPPDTEELIRQASGGDVAARDALLARHRERLRAAVAARFDARLAGRLDPSDVVQEVLAEAARKLDRYLAERPLPFYPWLRQLAWEHLVALHRRHVQAGRRTVRREEALAAPGESGAELADRLVASVSSPSQRATREEVRQRVQEALGLLSGRDREVLALRHLEGLAVAEAAGAMGVTPAALKMRHLRALERLRGLLEGPTGEGATGEGATGEGAT